MLNRIFLWFSSQIQKRKKSNWFSTSFPQILLFLISCFSTIKSLFYKALMVFLLFRCAFLLSQSVENFIFHYLSSWCWNPLKHKRKDRNRRFFCPFFFSFSFCLFSPFYPLFSFLSTNHPQPSFSFSVFQGIQGLWIISNFSTF